MEPAQHYFTKNLYVVEGMDMVGKSTFMKTCMPNHRIYHARHDLTDSTVGRNNSWTIGYGIIDFAEQMHFDDQLIYGNKYVIDRGVFSSYVYSRLYSQKEIDPKIVEWYRNNEFFKNKVGHVYIKHRNPDTAKIIFDASQSREKNPNVISNKYDQFNSFDDYWIFYYTADQLFREVYSLIGIKPRVFETLPDMRWEEVTEYYWRVNK